MIYLDLFYAKPLARHTMIDKAFSQTPIINLFSFLVIFCTELRSGRLSTFFTSEYRFTYLQMFLTFSCI